MITTFGLVFRL